MLIDDIDTDQIIPAEHLVYSLSDPEERNLYGKFALSSVPVAEFYARIFFRNSVNGGYLVPFETPVRLA